MAAVREVVLATINGVEASSSHGDWGLPKEAVRCAWRKGERRKRKKKKRVEENSVRVSRHVLDTCRAQDQDVATRASPG